MFHNPSRHSSWCVRTSISTGVLNNRHIHVSIAVALVALMSAISLTAAASAGAAPNERAAQRAVKRSSGGAWGWSSGARSWASRSKVLPTALVNRGPQAALTRMQFVAALARVETLRAAGGAPLRLTDPKLVAPARADAPAGSLGARALTLRWLTPIAGGFAPNKAITANEAALAMAGVVGLRGEVQTFATRLRAEVPGTTGSATYQSAHALIRSLGMRYNVRDPYDKHELGPTEAVNVAHGAYMLQVAATDTRSWKLDGAKRLANGFDLPVLGPNQTAVLAAGVKQLGQPYVWAGETEGTQAEGHGGFDCSGFAIRVTNGAGLAPETVSLMAERTTYTQSAIAAPKRITRAKLQPGDVIFFGDRGPRSSPSQNYHAGVYMGNGWFIHSSGGNGGVAIDSLDGTWWTSQFAWGRRILLTA